MPPGQLFTQTKYTLDLLLCIHLNTSKHISTLITSILPIFKNHGAFLMDPVEHHNIYWNLSILDIQFVVTKVS